LGLLKSTRVSTTRPRKASRNLDRAVLRRPYPVENHPPLFGPFGNVSPDGYAWSEKKSKVFFGTNRTLRLSWLKNIDALEKDYTDYYQLALLTAGLRGWLQGGETWIQALDTRLRED
jgi:hypothetical protein